MYFNIIYDIRIILQHTFFVDLSPYGKDGSNVTLCNYGSISNIYHQIHIKNLNCNKYKFKFQVVSSSFRKQSPIIPNNLITCDVIDKDSFTSYRKLAKDDVENFIDNWLMMKEGEEKYEFL